MEQSIGEVVLAGGGSFTPRSVADQLEEILTKPQAWRSLADLEKFNWTGLRTSPASVVVTEDDGNLVQLRNEVKALNRVIGRLERRLARMEATLEHTQELTLVISQSYYWSPEWQCKEKRADEDHRLGRSKRFSTAEDLINELNT